MHFQVVRAIDNRPMMGTEYLSCIPFDQLDSMNSSGYYFKLDGKKVSIKVIKDLEKQLPPEYRIEVKPGVSNNTKSRPAFVSAETKGIRCKDTGEVFKNQAEAARHFNIDPAQVSDSIKTGRPRSGYTFEKVIH